MCSAKEVAPLSPERQRLVEENVGIAYAIARKFRARLGEDAAAEAMLGLVYAAAAFEPARGNKFTTYAWLCVRGYVLSALGAQERAPKPVCGPELRIEDPECACDSWELWTEVRRLVPPRWSTATWLVHVEGLSFREAGLRLGVSGCRAQQMVARTMQRARERLSGWRYA